MTTKQEQRISCRKARNALSMFEHNVKSRMIVEKLLNLEEIQQAKVIASYNAINNECYLDEFNHYLQQIGKRVVYPITLNGEMDFYQAKEFEIGEYGIKVPVISSATKVDKSEIDVILVPLVGFNSKCYRLGQGGGYYDRYLKKVAATTIGVGFACQKCEDLIIEEHDKQLHMVVCENETYNRDR